MSERASESSTQRRREAPTERSEGVRSRAVAAYLRSDRMWSSGVRALRGIFDGCWLGVLDRDQLAGIDARYYDRTPEYHTEEYNRSGLFGWEQTAVDRHFAGVRDVLVTSAGAGREMLALSKQGFAVTGFEPHADLVRLGNRLMAADGIDATISSCARDAWPAAGGRAEAVLVGWSGYMLTPGRARRTAFLRGAAAVLPVGAPILVSFCAIEGSDVRLRVAASLGSRLRRLRGREPVALGDALIPNLVHFFTRDELTEELHEGGFDLVDYDTTEYGWAVGRVRPRPGEDKR